MLHIMVLGNHMPMVVRMISWCRVLRVRRMNRNKSVLVCFSVVANNLKLADLTGMKECVT